MGEQQGISETMGPHNLAGRSAGWKLGGAADKSQWCATSDQFALSQSPRQALWRARRVAEGQVSKVEQAICVPLGVPLAPMMLTMLLCDMRNNHSALYSHT